uniref:Ribonucleoside-diphosphate reductase large subunit n=1 Tax=Clandestinovirus TaxID=2831644 RepID=A0A8F8KQG8_9VIRU|nr:ribonucleoside-diphosphate reductase large subunit [Clandestinovirus]
MYTSPEEVAVCNLCSFSLPAFFNENLEGKFDHQLFYDVVRHFTGNLDNIIDINYYPIPEAEYSNKRHRPIGEGVQGFAELCFMAKIPYDSPEAAKLNEEIFETLYFAALSESCHLAKTKGKYDSYEGSPVSKGILQFDMWGEKPKSGRWNWDGLRQEIAQHGIRNSELIAPMPTATTSSIFGNTEAFEAQTSNCYARQTLSGHHQIVNPFLVRDLLALGLWTEEIRNLIIAHKGSVQAIPQIPDNIKAIYKTVWEIKQRVVADMAADRGKYVTQSMSLNVHMSHPDADELKKRLTGYHFYAWKKGLKTGMYYFRTESTAEAQQFTVDPSLLKKAAVTQAPVEVAKPVVTIADPEEDGPVCTMQEGCFTCGS